MKCSKLPKFRIKTVLIPQKNQKAWKWSCNTAIRWLELEAAIWEFSWSRVSSNTTNVWKKLRHPHPQGLVDKNAALWYRGSDSDFDLTIGDTPGCGFSKQPCQAMRSSLCLPDSSSTFIFHGSSLPQVTKKLKLARHDNYQLLPVSQFTWFCFYYRVHRLQGLEEVRTIQDFFHKHVYT